MSKYRKQMTKKQSRKNFTRTAVKTNPKNINTQPMRGGYRL